MVGVELFANLFFSLGLIEELGFKMIVAPFANREPRQPASHYPKNPFRHGPQFPTGHSRLLSSMPQGSSTGHYTQVHRAGPDE